MSIVCINVYLLVLVYLVWVILVQWVKLNWNEKCLGNLLQLNVFSANVYFVLKKTVFYGFSFS